MTNYKPTHQDRCEDPTCKGYGKPCVDRGRGFPVCETQQWRHEVYPGAEDKPMHPRYLKDASTFPVMGEHTHCFDGRTGEVI